MDLSSHEARTALLLDYTGKYAQYFRKHEQMQMGILTTGAAPKLQLTIKWEHIQDPTLDHGNYIFIQLWRGCRLWTQIPLIDPEGPAIMEQWITKVIRSEDKLQYVQLDPKKGSVDITSEMLADLGNTELIVVQW
jgi:hypothetical protein